MVKEQPVPSRITIHMTDYRRLPVEGYYVKASDVLLLSIIRYYTEKDGYFAMKREVIMEKLSLSASTLDRTIEKLLELNLIIKIDTLAHKRNIYIYLPALKSKKIKPNCLVRFKGNMPPPFDRFTSLYKVESVSGDTCRLRGYMTDVPIEFLEKLAEVATI